MEFLLMLIFIIVFAIIGGKALFKMPNPGSRFYDKVNDDKKKN